MDQAVVLFGFPKEVTGFVGSQRAENSSGFEDSFTAILRYQGGPMVTAKAAVISPEAEQLRYWICGEKGSWKKVYFCCPLFYWVYAEKSSIILIFRKTSWWRGKRLPMTDLGLSRMSDQVFFLSLKVMRFLKRSILT
jgi:hypothetical protein